MNMHRRRQEQGSEQAPLLEEAAHGAGAAPVRPRLPCIPSNTPSRTPANSDSLGSGPVAEITLDQLGKVYPDGTRAVASST